jgi:hypothetical protein
LEILRLWLSIFLVLTFLSFSASCVAPNRYRSGLEAPLAPIYKERRLTIIFERENDFSSLANIDINIILDSPAKLISPAVGLGRTNQEGRLELIIEPVAVYDQHTLKGEDVIIDYPAILTISFNDGSKIYEWKIDASESFARYQDPLYQGLNRDPDSAPYLVTLTIP